MSIKKELNGCTLRLEKGDITDSEVEAFVYYAQSHLKLGAGFGNAIALRGGLSITKELESIGSVEATQAVVTLAGKLKAKHIVHANGPKFQEPDTPSKLEKTIENSLRAASDKGINQLAFPPMGVGFYGVPLPLCAEIMLKTLRNYLNNSPAVKDIIIFANDDREYRVFVKEFEKL